MRILLILSIVVIANAGLIKEDCNGVKLNDVYHEPETLYKDLDRPYLLTVDHNTNILYFSYTIPEKDGEEFKTARINLNTKEFKTLSGINNGFAQTVDQTTHDIYIGGSDGIYKYDYGSDKAELFTEKGTNIWNVYYKDCLYYIVFPSQFLFSIYEEQSVRFKDLEDTKVDNFVIDNNNTIFFTNATGLYSQEKGTKNATLYEEFPNVGVRGIAVDRKGVVYVCLKDGIFVVNKEKVGLEKVVDVDDAFGVTFDNDNNLIYADATSLVRLKPNRSKNCFLVYLKKY